jgi:hypothetical protein
MRVWLLKIRDPEPLVVDEWLATVMGRRVKQTI